MSIRIGAIVKAYGGNSLHDKYRIFTNGEYMKVLETRSEYGADWVRVEHDDRNENAVTQYWFLKQQLQEVGAL